MKNKLILKSAVVSVFIYILVLASCVGGGGGGGGASLPDSQYSTHNPGGWGGNGGSGGTDGSGSGGVNTTGGTPLVVDHYVYNGATYTGAQIQDLIAAIQNDTSRQNTSFTVQFYVAGESTPREARVTKGNTRVTKFEHQYKATCTNTQTSTTFTKTFYKDNGLDLSAETTTPNMAWLCAQNGQRYGSLITGFQNDITLSTVFNAPDCEISLTQPVGASGPGPYQITDLNGEFGFTIAYTNGNPLPDGTTYVWKANGNSLSSNTEDCSASTGAAGITESRNSGTRIGTNASTATAITITCDVTIPGEPTVQFTKQISVFKRVTLPTDFALELTDKPTTAGNSTPYVIWNSTDTFRFSVNGITFANLPEDIEFHWYVNDTEVTGGTESYIDLTYSQMGTVSTSSTALEVKYKLDHNDKTNSLPQEKSIGTAVKKVSIPAMKINVTEYPSLPINANGAYHVNANDSSTQWFTFQTVLDNNSDTLPGSLTYDWILNDTSVGSPVTSNERVFELYLVRGSNSAPTSNETKKAKCRVRLSGSDICDYVDTPEKEFKFTPPKSSSELNSYVSISLNPDNAFQVNTYNYYYVNESNWNTGLTIGQLDTSSLPAGYAFQWRYDYVNMTGTINFHKTGSDPTFSISPKEFYGNVAFPAPPDSLGNCTGNINYKITAPGYEPLNDSVSLGMSGDNTGIP